MRPPVRRALGLLAATALTAAKPVPPGDGPGPTDAQAWRSRGIPICIARLREIRAFTPDDLETVCGCTFDSWLEGHRGNPLPGLEPDHLPVAVEQQLLDCTSETRADLRQEVRQLGAIWRPGAPPIPGGGRLQDPPPFARTGAMQPPVENPPVDASTGGKDSGPGFRDWVGTLTLPAWLTGASLLWWVALGIFLFGLLVLKLRRRDPRNDLMGPPAHMRRGAPARPPRRPDLPR